MASCPQKLLSEYLTVYMYEVTHHMLTFSSDRLQFKHCIVWWLTAETISVSGICIMTGFRLKPCIKWLQDSFTGFSEIQGPWVWFSATVGFFAFLLIHLITDLSCSPCSRSPPLPPTQCSIACNTQKTGRELGMMLPKNGFWTWNAQHNPHIPTELWNCF